MAEVRRAPDGTAAAACSPPGIFGHASFSLRAVTGSVRAHCARSAKSVITIPRNDRGAALLSSAHCSQEISPKDIAEFIVHNIVKKQIGNVDETRITITLEKQWARSTKSLYTFYRTYIHEQWAVDLETFNAIVLEHVNAHEATPTDDGIVLDSIGIEMRETSIFLVHAALYAVHEMQDIFNMVQDGEYFSYAKSALGGTIQGGTAAVISFLEKLVAANLAVGARNEIFAHNIVESEIYTDPTEPSTPPGAEPAVGSGATTRSYGTSTPTPRNTRSEAGTERRVGGDPDETEDDVYEWE